MSAFTSHIVELIRGLLDRDLPYREIAARIGVSIGAVYRVAKNQWAPKSREKPDPNLRRCPDCGAMAFEWPCRTCEARACLRRTLHSRRQDAQPRRAA